jgi:hypothetical protein
MKTFEVQSQMLKSIINETFNVNIMDKSRKRDIVDARYVYAKIMLDEGYTLVSVANGLKKHHSTIIHYMEQSDFALNNIRELNHKYNIVKSKFIGLELPENGDFTRRQLIMRIKAMEEELDQLRTFKVHHEIINNLYDR